MKCGATAYYEAQKDMHCVKAQRNGAGPLRVELQQDQVNDQEDIPVEIKLPAGFDAQAVKFMSPDFEGTEEVEFTITNEYITFTVPQLHIWDVVMIE